jgi:enoyl-CoA hydratase
VREAPARLRRGTAGGHFCGGNDLDEFASLSPLNSAGRTQAVREAFWSIYDCPLPVVTAVQGSAMGTERCLAASSDLIVCGQTARFGLPEISVGVMGGARHLARLATSQVMRRMFLTADPMTGAELMAHGAVKRALNQIEHLDLKSGAELE